MKRKEKNGHEKMHGKQEEIAERSCFSCRPEIFVNIFGKKFDVSATEKQVQPVQQPLLSENESNITAGGNESDIVKAHRLLP